MEQKGNSRGEINSIELVRGESKPKVPSSSKTYLHYLCKILPPIQTDHSHTLSSVLNSILYVIWNLIQTMKLQALPINTEAWLEDYYSLYRQGSSSCISFKKTIAKWNNLLSVEDRFYRDGTLIWSAIWIAVWFKWTKLCLHASGIQISKHSVFHVIFAGSLESTYLSILRGHRETLRG